MNESILYLPEPKDIVSALLAKGMKQLEIAKQSGVSKTGVNLIAHGAGGITLTNYRRLLAFAALHDCVPRPPADAGIVDHDCGQGMHSSVLSRTGDTQAA